MDKPTRGMDFHIHGLIGLIYEAAMDVDLWPVLLRNLCDVLESPVGEVSSLAGFAGMLTEDEVTGPSQALAGKEQGSALALSVAQLIRPHFTRALHLNRDLGRQRHQSALFAQLLERFPLGLGLLVREGEILQQNRQFDELLHHDRRLRLKDGKLAFSDAQTQQHWRDALARLSAGEETSAVVPISDNGASPLSALLLAYRREEEAPGATVPTILLCLAAPGLLGQAAETDLAQLFQLTKAESRLLAALVNGYSIEDYADEAGLSRNTLRSQMKSLFRKTGTNRQEEVVRQVLNSPALIAGERHNHDRPEVNQTPRDERRLQQGICLADGRWLSFAEYGPIDGRPLLFAHGLTGCRLQTHPDESALYEQGIRLLVPDRPGFGMSDIDEKRSVLGWADDVKQLLDRLELEQVDAMGFSVGGIFAMALARQLPQRLRQLTLVSSMGAFNEVDDLNGMIPRNRMILILGRYMPGILTPFMQLMVDSLRRNPQQYFDDLLKNLPPFERHYLRHPAMKATITRAFIEATRNGVRGLVYEQMLLSQPWGFCPDEISVPVQLWHGAEDVHVPLAMSRQLASQLSRCSSHLLEDSGHFLLYDRWQDILSHSR